VFDNTGAAHEEVAAPRAIAPAIAMTIARFIVCLFMINILWFLRAISGGKSLVRHR
jgi:hypothetical protein